MEVVLVLRQAKSWAILLSGNMVFFYHIAEAIRTRKWHIVVNYIQCSKCLCPNNIVVGWQRWSIWVMGRFVSSHSTELRCFAVAMCFLMSYLPLAAMAAMLKSAEQILQYAQLFPFFVRLDKIPSFLVLFFKCLISALRSEVDVEAGVAIFKYFSFKLHEKFTYSSHVFTAMAAAVMPNAFLSNVFDWSKRSNVIIFLESQNTFVKAKLHFMTSWPTYVFFIESSDWFKKSKLLPLYSLHQWQISL